MPIPVGFNPSGLIEKIGPGGVYFKYARIVLIALGSIFVILLAAFIFPSIKKYFVKPPSAPLVEKCTKPSAKGLAKGFQSWQFSYGNGYKGPQIQTATVDTLTPPMGSTQTVTLTIKNDSPITNATATLVTDNTSQNYPLELTKGTATDGTWTGILKMNDTTGCIYHIDFVMVSPSGSSTNALTFR